jgi:SAM-dependent methyltransferase
MDEVGIQKAGTSSEPIYQKAYEILRSYCLPRDAKVADIGGGSGHFSKLLLNDFDRVVLIDYEPVTENAQVELVHADLNATWPDFGSEMDFVVALEVIEHLENPRHFIRELVRRLSPGGHAIISTPNQLSLASRACFMLRGQHQHFQESCYPAHITPLLSVDFLRIYSEVGAEAVGISYTNSGRIPGTEMNWQKILPLLKGQSFSDNLFFELKRPMD